MSAKFVLIFFNIQIISGDSYSLSDLQPGIYNYRIEITGSGTGFSQIKQFVLIK